MLQKVSAPAINGSAFKQKQPLLSQQAIDLQNTLEKLKKMQTPEPTTQEQTINIYAPQLFDDYGQESIIKPQPVPIKQQVQQVPQKKKTYNKMTNEEADVAYRQRQQMIKQQIQRTKKVKPSLNRTIQSQQIDLSTCSNFRRKSIEQPIRTIPTPQPRPLSKPQQSQTSELSGKKEQLMRDIERIDQEIRDIKRNKGQELYQQGRQLQDIRQHKKKENDKLRQQKEMKECTFKPQINTTSRKLNSSRMTPQLSPKVDQRSSSSDHFYLKQINEKYEAIMKQAQKLFAHN
ncbi:hypothetical protein pb186bvf_007399 [Paramecium bursaria]